MRFSTIGDGQKVSVLSIGSYHTYDRMEHDEIVALLRRAVDAGINWFDVGHYTSAAHPELPESDTDKRFAAARRDAGIGRDERIGAESATYLVLGDLMHDPGDFDDIVGEVGELMRAGKVKHWAVNNWSASQLGRIADQAASAGVEVPQFAQLKYSLTRRSIGEGRPFADLIKRTGITLQSSDVFEGGLLFGTSTSRIIALDVGGVQKRIMASVGEISRVASSLDTTVGALAIAFVLTNPSVSNVLVGTRTLQQLEQNLAAFDLLDRHSADELRAAVAHLWLDRDAVGPDASWGDKVDADPASYPSIIKPASVGA